MQTQNARRQSAERVYYARARKLIEVSQKSEVKTMEVS